MLTSLQWLLWFRRSQSGSTLTVIIFVESSIEQDAQKNMTVKLFDALVFALRTKKTPRWYQCLVGLTLTPFITELNFTSSIGLWL